jgi:hypothetical protein
MERFLSRERIGVSSTDRKRCAAACLIGFGAASGPSSS